MNAGTYVHVTLILNSLISLAFCEPWQMSLVMMPLVNLSQKKQRGAIVSDYIHSPQISTADKLTFKIETIHS